MTCSFNVCRAADILNKYVCVLYECLSVVRKMGKKYAKRKLSGKNCLLVNERGGDYKDHFYPQIEHLH